MRLFKLFCPMYFKPIFPFKPHLIWATKIYQSAFITQEERLSLTAVSFASVTCLLVLMYWSLQVLDSRSTTFNGAHPGREAFPLLWRSILEKRQLTKQGKNTSVWEILVFKID